MGLFDKLKNVLFEEEEIEEEIKPLKEKDDEPKEKLKLPKINRTEKKEGIKQDYDVEKETDRELFNVEKTFDFPDFDEDEFDDFLPKAKEVKEEVKIEEPTSRKLERISILEQKEKEEQARKEILRKDISITRTVDDSKKIFRPSPVISPVYGILDKNYKKEDVVTKEELEHKGMQTKSLDVDSVRKKAFGTLEEGIVKKQQEVEEKEEVLEIQPKEDTIEIPIVEEVKEEIVQPVVEEPIIEDELEDTVDLDNLLDKTIDMEIDVTKEMELPSRSEDKDYEELAKQEVEEELKLDEPLTEEVINEEVVQEDNNDEENDLFDLIDSMYESGDDE